VDLRPIGAEIQAKFHLSPARFSVTREKIPKKIDPESSTSCFLHDGILYCCQMARQGVGRLADISAITT
jgi:hypothetical protein